MSSGRPSQLWTPEQIQFVQDNKEKSVKKIRELFNARYAGAVQITEAQAKHLRGHYKNDPRYNRTLAPSAPQANITSSQPVVGPSFSSAQPGDQQPLFAPPPPQPSLSSSLNPSVEHIPDPDQSLLGVGSANPLAHWQITTAAPFAGQTEEIDDMIRMNQYGGYQHGSNYGLGQGTHNQSFNRDASLSHGRYNQPQYGAQSVAWMNGPHGTCRIPTRHSHGDNGIVSFPSEGTVLNMLARARREGAESGNRQLPASVTGNITFSVPQLPLLQLDHPQFPGSQLPQSRRPLPQATGLTHDYHQDWSGDPAQVAAPAQTTLPPITSTQFVHQQQLPSLSQAGTADPTGGLGQVSDYANFAHGQLGQHSQFPEQSSSGQPVNPEPPGRYGTGLPFSQTGYSDAFWGGPGGNGPDDNDEDYV